MHLLSRNIALTIFAATVAMIAFSMSVLVAVFSATGATVPVQSIVLVIAMPIVLTPAVFYPLLHMNRKLRRMAVELERQVRTDMLTELPNRRAFFEFAQSLLEQPLPAKTLLAAMTIDADHFKGVNDHYGHAQGDRVLKEVADVIFAEVSAANASHWIVARLGGEEFAVLADGLVPSAVGRLAERICAQVHRSVAIGPEREAVTVSVGVAFQRPGMQIDRLLKLSDDAVYDAKRAGRNRWAFAPGEADRIVRGEERAAG